MLQRIREVITIANSPTSDPASKKQALDFLTEARSDPNAAQLFSSLLTDLQSDDLARFVALQVLCDIVKDSSNNNSQQSLIFIKDVVSELLQTKITNNIRDPEYVRNKISELITGLFYNMYGDCNSNHWSSFFQDLITLSKIDSLTKSPIDEFSKLGLDYFLRICGFINSEIADQTFIRSKELQIKNNNLKDTMRIRDIQTLVTIWLNTLKASIPQQLQQQSNATGIVVLTLSVIGSYISWIDLSLIVNPEYISVIYSYLDFPGTRIACAQALCEIIAKKMKPMEKLNLLSMLNLTDKVTSLEHDDIEVYEQLAKLSASVGLELSIILEQCNEGDSTPEIQQVANSADQQILTQVAPLVFKFMSHEYDSVTQQCFPFISQYLSILKKIFALGGKPGCAIALMSKKQPLDPQHQEFIISLLNIIFKKMKIDESSDEDSEDEIEEFTETIRSKLKIFQDSIAIINPAIYLENISNHIQLCLAETDWRYLELGIYQMTNLSESIKNNLFGITKNEIASSQPTMVMFKFMDILLRNSAVFQIDNQYVQILFFELVVRHHSYLSGEKDDIVLLNIFCSNFGMFNKREKVRLRTWYLFTRLLKTTKPKFSVSVLSEIIAKLVPLLQIKVINLNQDGTESDTTFDNQLYLFEGVGLLIGGNSDSTYNILDEILTPLFTELEKCISAQSQDRAIILQCHHILMAIGTLARGIHGGLVPENQVNNALVSKKLIDRSLIEKFSNIAEVVLVTFSYFNKYENVRDASRFTFSRLIPILNNEMVPFANKLIALFLESDLKMLEMNDFLGFLGQMIHMFRKDEGCYQLFNELLTPVIAKYHAVLEGIEDENTKGPQSWYPDSSNVKDTSTNGKNIVLTDTFRDKVIMSKAYFAFLQTLITNSVTSLLLTEKTRQILPSLLTELLTYTPEEVQETSAMKLALNVLNNFIKYFGSGKCTDPNDTHAVGLERLDGLNEFFITKIVPLVFEIPFRPEYKFNVKEGGYRIVATDLSRALKEIYLQSGGGSDVNANPCLKYMVDLYLPQIQFPQQLIMELVEALITSDQKGFEKYYLTLIGKLTS
ncbi:Ran GTPase-binding protein LOS1 NDAI_0D01480 [Naumovozyma dairenensis CBS 421]|uniref:Exportin-T n=1 Tax=Naumovozyma dairenensis (strain ATCC 10597 / BCRC 20456 / CBS 421 / NBRC 0211 / NRRL Y-12639) TaxID=1071378 RepID=G0W9K1_NAUDC|nr:hypothetical protein NDAI_0D01480 [Naumovozyma dairenensis CBS 421]CCD24462.1 hypothetical protein NDAI_0D01480 [Naumovozyma dairenensis CBS 421]